MGCGSSLFRRDARTAFAAIVNRVVDEAEARELVIAQGEILANDEGKQLDLSAPTVTRGLPYLIEAAADLGGSIERLILVRSAIDEARLTQFADALARLRELKKINLEGNQMVSVPEVLFQLPLDSLSLSDNALTSLPPGLSCLSGTLVELEIRKNFLSALPDEIGQLNNLRHLSVGRNQIRTLPASLGSCDSLVMLLVEHNRLTELPEELRTLTALEDVNLHNNRMTELPATLLELPALRWLSLGKNKLTALPEALFAMPALEVLHAQSNVLQDLQLPAAERTATSPGTAATTTGEVSTADSAAARCERARRWGSKLKVLWLSDNPVCKVEDTMPELTLSLQRALPSLTDLRMRSTKGLVPVRSNSIDEIIQPEVLVDSSPNSSPLWRRSSASGEQRKSRRSRVSFAGDEQGAIAQAIKMHEIGGPARV